MPAPTEPTASPSGRATAPPTPGSGRLHRITLILVVWVLGAWIGSSLARGPLRAVDLPCPFCDKSQSLTPPENRAWNYNWCDDRRAGLTGLHVAGAMLLLWFWRRRAAARPDLLEASAAWQRRLAIGLLIVGPVTIYATLPAHDYSNPSDADATAWTVVAAAGALLAGSIGSYWTRVVGLTAAASALTAVHAYYWLDAQWDGMTLVAPLMVTPFAALVFGPWPDAPERESAIERPDAP